MADTDTAETIDDDIFDDLDWPPPVQWVRGVDLMKALKPNELNELIESAYRHWRVRMGFSNSERPLIDFDDEALAKSHHQVRNGGGWLRYLRRINHLSANKAANLVGVGKSTYVDYERCERTGTISMTTLATVARALGAELLIGMQPIEFPSRSMWRRLERPAVQMFSKLLTTRASAPRALGTIAHNLTKKPKLRRSEGWTERI